MDHYHQQDKSKKSLKDKDHIKNPDEVVDDHDHVDINSIVEASSNDSLARRHSKDSIRPSSSSHQRKLSTTSTVSFTPSLFDVDEAKFLGRDHKENKQDWNVHLGCQNLASILIDPSIPRSYQETLFTKDWGYSFVELPVEVDPVEVTRKQLLSMRTLLKDVRKRSKHLAKLELQLKNQGSSNHNLLFQPRIVPRPDQNLDRIPEVFLRKEFDLSNPDTFNTVIAFNSNDVPSSSSSSSSSKLKEILKPSHLTPPSHALNNSLTPSSSSSSIVSLSSNFVGNSQRNLSDILDLVEDNLSHQIALRFRDFFHIMNAMDVLMDQVSRTIKEVTCVRGKCDLLKQSLVKPCLKQVLLTRTRSNCQDTLEKLQLMNTLHQSNSRINLLLSTKDYVGALTLISLAKLEMQDNLPGVKCFKHLSSELTEREILIEKFLEEDFNKMLTQEFLQPFHAGHLDTSSGSSSSSAASSRKGSNNTITPLDVVVDDEEALIGIITGMIRVKMFNFVDVFREEARAAVITVKKQTLIQALSKEDIDVDNRNEDALYQQLKSLEFKKWLAILKETFANLTTLLSRVTAVNSIIVKTLNSCSIKEASLSSCSTTIASPSLSSRSTPERTPTPVCLDEVSVLKWTNSTKSCLLGLVDFAQGEGVVLIESRVKDGLDRMTTHDFTVFAKTVQGFVSSCKSFLLYIQDSSSPVTYIPTSSLKGVLSTQANKFATRFHEERKKKLTSLLEIEQWKSMDVISTEFQSLVDSIVSGSCSFSSPVPLSPPPLGQIRNGSVKNVKSSAKMKPESSSSTQFAVVSGEKFTVVNSVVLCISLMSEYVSTAIQVPVMTSDLLTRLVDLIKHFNSRSLKLVLHGEAKQVSGLKSVTSRVLANCCRAIQLIIKTIPSVKKEFDLLLTANGASTGQKELLLGLFDETLTGLRDHVEKIHDRIYCSCKDFMAAKLNKWEAKPPVPSPVFQTITQHLGLLDDNLEDCLPERDLGSLFKKIDSALKDILREQLTRLNVVNDGGPQHGYLVLSLFESHF